MSNMFDACRSLISLDVSNFNTENVTSMRFMFDGCSELTSLDVSNFDTKNVKDMGYMFGSCGGLTSLDVSNFDTGKVTSMESMFSGCSGLTSIDLSNFNTGKVTNMTNMFNDCTELTTIYTSYNFTTEKVSKSSFMFLRCTKLVGGNGKRYNSRYTDKTYARIDTPNTPGYFTEKNPQSGYVNLDNMMIADEDVSISRTDYLQTKQMLAGDTAEAVIYSTADTNEDDEGNEVHWVKNGNVWTYTFYVDDPNAEWYVWEDFVPEGYISNYTINNPGKVENQQAKVINLKHENDSPSGDDDEKNFISYGNLAISKVLKDSNGRFLTPNNDNTEFTITINLTAPDGYEELISGTKIFGDYVFKDGVGKIKIQAGQTITIPGIVVGTTYSVDETSLNGYNSSYDSNTGTISSESDSTVTFINTIKSRESGDPDNPSSGYVDINLEKVVTGHYEVDDSYTFEITLNNLDEYKTYLIEKYLSNGNMEVIDFVADSVGFANVMISLKNGEHITLKDIPIGATYKVFEYAGDYTSSYSIVDSSNLNMINSTADMNSKPNKALSTANETADEGEAVTITYTNQKKQVQDLKLVKTVTDDEDTNSYIFEIEFSNMNNGDSFNSSVGKITADQDGKAELTIYLAGGEEAEFYSVPVGTKYRIKELASTSIASYTIVDSNGLDKIENASSTNTRPKEALSTELETVNEGEDVTVTFVNDTVSVNPEEAKDKVEVSVGVTKIVVNEDEEVLEDNEDTFTFELRANDDSYPMPSSTEATVTGNGTASFGTITFTETGTYVYEIKEKAEDSDRYTYDNAIYTLVFEVTKPEGLLEVTRAIMRNGFMGSTITFTNILNPEPDDEPSEDDKDDDKEEEKEEHDEEDNNNDEEKDKHDEGNNTSDDQVKEDNKDEVKTGDVVVIYLVNMVIASIVLVVSVKDKRKRR